LQKPWLTASRGSLRVALMNKRERERMHSILDMANRLMDGPSNAQAQITNADVVEAILGDLVKLLNSFDPVELPKLIELDKA